MLKQLMLYLGAGVDWVVGVLILWEIAEVTVEVVESIAEAAIPGIAVVIHATTV